MNRKQAHGRNGAVDLTTPTSIIEIANLVIDDNRAMTITLWYKGVVDDTDDFFRMLEVNH